jgi:hypothetical protein
VIFFVGFQPAAYHMLGFLDLAFFVPEAILLSLAFRAVSTMATVPKGLPL